ncbi:uncharacterized protein [Euphorbia lathyris]|uniref:uncharacterized protein n=1 Tax=Euphorbia lathyris TaxID=212925 RepID=UPI003313C0AA
MAGSKILSDENVKAPNLVERAKEKIQAVLHSERFHFHQKKDVNEHTPINNVKAPNVFDRAKEEIEAHQKSNQSAEAISNRDRRHHRYSETHGRRDDIDENTGMDEIKGPSIFQRAKEEVEALFGTIHPRKKESRDSVSEGGFGGVVGRGLEKVCSGEIGASIGRRLEKVCSPSNSKGACKPDDD